MTDTASLVNLALQAFGSRSTVTAAMLTAGSSNEAKQANLVFTGTRDSLLRMAPWDCAMHTDNLVYITSLPGTPENTSTPTSDLWAPGLPRPPWTYEYQYPADCLRACWIIPQMPSSTVDDIPITPVQASFGATTWMGTPPLFKVGTDKFVPVTAAAVAAGGTGHAVGDIITLPLGATTSPPIGAPVKLTVATVAAGVITSVTVVPSILDSSPAQGGSYFAAQTNPVAQSSTTGSGIGATFTLTFGTKSDQRVILTNQPDATMVYVRQITDPNVWDPSFTDAFIQALAANLSFALTGDKKIYGMCIANANQAIMEAREADGNEGLTIVDPTPDFIRVRGYASDSLYTGQYSSYDWGGLLPSFG